MATHNQLRLKHNPWKIIPNFPGELIPLWIFPSDINGRVQKLRESKNLDAKESERKDGTRKTEDGKQRMVGTVDPGFGPEYPEQVPIR